MPASQLRPANGAVTIPGSIVADFGSMEIAEAQAVESVAAYGAAVYDPYRASGTPHSAVTVAGFVKAYASTTQVLGASGGLSDPDGGTGTFTLDTNVSVSGAYVIESVRIMHARLRAAVPATWSMHNSADPTITWQTT